MTERAFPVIYASNVERMVSFYQELGFVQQYRLPPEGEVGYVGPRRGDSELAIATTASQRGRPSS